MAREGFRSICPVQQCGVCISNEIYAVGCKCKVGKKGYRTDDGLIGRGRKMAWW